MRVCEVRDFQAKELDIYARLTENQLLSREDPEKGVFIAESPKVVLRALEAGCQPLSVLVEKKQIEGEASEVLRLLPEEIPVFTADSAVLRELTGFPMTRGLLCAMRRPKPVPAEVICRQARRLVVLERVMNPTNVGAIFRSAAALGMDGILLTPDCSNPLYRRAIRVSMGTVFQIPWAYIGEKVSDWPEKGMELLCREGFRTAAMALSDESVSVADPVLLNEQRLAVLMGSEGDGLLPETIRLSDYTVKIPMMHGVDSLNVAAASAVAFWVLAGRQQA